MKILALDSSTEACSAALLFGDEIIEQYEFAPMQHNKLILKMIESLLSEAGLSFSQLDCLAFSNGPGSYTGLRLSAGVIQGIAFAHHLPVALISSLAVLAQTAVRQLNAKKILSALDARMGQLFWGVYQLNNKGFVEALQADSVIDPTEVKIPNSSDWIGIGSGWGAYKNELKHKVINHVNQMTSDFYPHAQDVIPLAKRKVELQEMVISELALPVYLRDVK